MPPAENILRPLCDFYKFNIRRCLIAKMNQYAERGVARLRFEDYAAGIMRFGGEYCIATIKDRSVAAVIALRR